MSNSKQTHLRDALRKTIAKSERRARRRFASDALGLARRYGMFDSFLREMRLELAIRRSLNIAFIPFREPGIFCAYLLESADSVKILEMEEGWQSILENLRVRFNGRGGYIWLKYHRQRVISQDKHAVTEVLRELEGAIYGLRFDVENMAILAVSLDVPDEWVSEEPQLASLSGVLVLWATESELPQRNASAEAEKVRSVHRSYLSQARRLLYLDPASVLQGGLFTSRPGSLEGTLRQKIVLLGITNAIYMLLHRIGNFIQEGAYIADKFSSAAKVAQYPDRFDKHVRNLRIQIDRLIRLKKSLEGISTHAQAQPITVEELLDIFKHQFNVLSKEEEANAVLVTQESALHLLSMQVGHPPSLIEELFTIHIENALRELKREETKDKRLVLDIHEESGYVCFRIINYGPAIPPDILVDLRRAVRVQRPQRTGLGVFLSSIIMSLIGGEIGVESPVKGKIGACFILKFPKWR